MFSGQGRFDGMEVELYEGKFAGGFDLEEDEGEQVSYDTTFVFMVTAVAGKTTFDVTNQGDVKRVTQFDLRDVVILNPEDANAQFVLQELAGNLLGADELEGQGSVLAAIADAEADDEVELTLLRYTRTRTILKLNMSARWVPRQSARSASVPIQASKASWTAQHRPSHESGQFRNYDFGCSVW